GGNLGESVKQVGADRPERLVVTRFDTRQHIQDVLKIGKAAAGAYFVDVGARRQDIDDVFAAGKEIGNGGEHGDSRLEGLLIAWPVLARQESIEDQRDAAEVLFLILLHYGLPAASPRTPVDILYRIAFPVLSRPHEFNGVTVV